MKPRRSRNARPAPLRWQAWALAALVTVAILFGGGGAEGPVNNGIIQALSAILLALVFASHVRGSWPLSNAARGATWILIALLIIVVLQLVPLPPEVWRALPGRDLANSSLSLIGSSNQWRPHSLDPDGTRRFAAFLLLPMAILYGLVGATRRETLLVVRAIVFAAGVSALAGALQLILGNPDWLTYYEGPNPGAASGVFANANHHAALLNLAILCLALLIRAERGGETRGGGGTLLRDTHPGWLALPFFVAMILATGSRAGLILLALAAPGAMLIALGRRSPLLWLGGLAAVALVILVTVLFSPSGNMVAIGHSFIFSQDSRYSFLPDVLYTLRQYWPWGSGIGTFVQVFAPNENLDVASSGYVNHAHNDLVEWLIETGIIGAIWLVAALAAVLWRLFGLAARRNELRGSHFAAVLAGALILLLLALHSLVDYPARVAALSAAAAMAVSLIFTPMTDAPPRAVVVHGRPRWPLAIGGILGLVVGGLALRLFVVEAAVRDGNGALALQFQPQHGRALALAAEQQLKARNPGAARQLARAAIERAPLTPRAVRVVAMAAPDASAGIAAWRVASAMGWRDRPTQLWAFQQSLANSEWSLAAVRADAFLRTRTSKPQEYLAVLRTAAMNRDFRMALSDRLIIDPAWRTIFFQVPEKVTDEEVRGTVETLRTLAQRGDDVTLGEISPTISRLIERKQFDQATDLYRLISGGRSASSLDDGGFDRPVDDYRTNSTPFDWLIRPVTGGTATIEEQNGRYLFVETDGTASRMLVRRYLRVPPGAYRLDYSRRGQADSPEAITISIQCVDGPQIGASSSVPLQRSGFEPRQISFVVGPNCPMIMLVFEAKPLGRPASAEFDEFSLRRVP